MSFTVDTSKFNAMCRDLSRVSAASMRNVIQYEAGKVMEAAVRITPAVKLANLTYNAVSGRAITVDIGNGMKTYWMDNRFSDAVWSQLQAARKEIVTRKLKARGLTKQSWWLLAKRFGLAVAAPAYVQQARPSDGRTYDNAEAQWVKGIGRVALVVGNAMPVLQSPYVSGARILQRAINRRVSYFRMNVKKKVFGDMSTIAKRYPGIHTAPF